MALMIISLAQVIKSEILIDTIINNVIKEMMDSLDKMVLIIGTLISIISRQFSNIEYSLYLEIQELKTLENKIIAICLVLLVVLL
jgi:hypothetical protein